MDTPRRLVVVAIGAFAALSVGALVVFSVATSDGCVEPRYAIEGEGIELLEARDMFEVVVTSDEGFYVGALLWILRIGPLEFDRSAYPEFANTKLAFPIPHEALPMLADGDGIEIRYGNPIGSGTTGFAPVDFERRAIDGLDDDRSDGFAKWRVADGC